MARKTTSVSEAIRRAIVKSGQTAMDVERGTGVSNAVVGRFLRKKRGLNLATVDKLAHYLGLELVTRKGRSK